MKIRSFILFVLSIFSNFSISQNIVPNGDFESYTSLPTGFAQANRATGWNNVNGVYNGLNGTPDYYHTSGFMGSGSIIPIAPNNGQGQMALGTGFPAWSSYREYISTQLNSTLIVGQEYQLTFYLTNADNIGGSDNFGVHFSEFPLHQSTNEVIPVVPQVVIPGVVIHTNYWQKYTMNFTANTPANYITIGNFETGQNTTFIDNSAYYYIDDIELITYLPFQIQGESSICLGDSTTLIATNATVIGWADSLTQNNILSTDSIFTVSPNSTTTYYAFSANDTASFTVYVNNYPIVNLGSDTTLCEGNLYLLDATFQNATYLWQDSTTTPTFNVSHQGVYWVELTENNCSSSDTVEINYTQAPYFNLGNDTTLCQNETLQLDATIEGSTYLWQDNSTKPTFKVTQQGTYWVEVELNHCQFSDTIIIDYKPKPYFDLGADVVSCDNESIILDVTTPNSTYLWNDNSTESFLEIDVTGNYWVEVTSNGCSSVDEISVTIGCEGILEMPNVFTPNNDGVNDFFVPVKSEWITSMKTVIVNRWGNVVFETSQPKIYWDGKNVVDGTYFYTIEYVFKNGDKNKLYGFVKVIR